MVAEHFAKIDGKPICRWVLIDGHIMTGRLVAVSPCRDAFTVLRPDGTTCHVPRSHAKPATPEDVLSSLSFFGRGKGARHARR